MRYFLRLAYRGASFHGWQRQPNADSVQQRIEEALSTVLRCPISIVGAGRTDTGVNARCMYAHFDYDIANEPGAENEQETLIRLRGFLPSLNRLVGPDIAMHEIIPVSQEAHARFDATSRTYKYFVTYAKNPFRGPLAWHTSRRLDVGAMNSAASVLLETEDFTSFAKLHSDSKTNLCNVTHAEWVEENEGITFTITADRFLRNMVRAVVGTLVDVGRGKLTLKEFCDIIEAKDRCSAGTSMPGEALFLWDIKYPFL